MWTVELPGLPVCKPSVNSGWSVFFIYTVERKLLPNSQGYCKDYKTLQKQGLTQPIITTHVHVHTFTYLFIYENKR